MNLPTLNQRDEPISNLGALYGIIPPPKKKTNKKNKQTNFDRTKLCKQIVNILIRHRIMHYAVSDLGLHCLPMSHKKDARLIWVKLENILIESACFNCCCFLV